VHEMDELVEQLEEEESWRSGGWGRWLASVGLGGLLVAAFVLLRRWQKSGKKKKSIVVAEAPVIAAAAAVPALQKMSVSETVLGYGSCGTVVYEGRLDNRRIAVKRMLREFYALAERECDILLRGDSHPNVVSYFLKEEDSRFVYLALSYCSLTLGELFGEERQEGEGVAPVAARPDAERAREFALADTVRLLHQVASGLAHLHALGVVHRDLKVSICLGVFSFV
jgi:serine/threonine-protein kinase/endoribonuclease IRE1